MGRLDAFLQATRERVNDGAYAGTGPRLTPNGSLAAALARPGRGRRPRGKPPGGSAWKRWDARVAG